MSLLRGQPKAMGRTASSVGLCAHSSRLVIRPYTAARLPVATAAAADTETAATAVPEPVAAPVAEAAAAPASDAPQSTAEPAERRSAAAGGRRGRQGRDSSADSEEDEHIVRIGAETIATKVAAYLFNVFKDRGSDYTLRLQAAGAPAYANALKAMARLQQMLANEASTADRCVVFKPRGVQVLAKPRDGQPAQRINTMRIVLTLAPKSDWPAAAFEPAQNSSEASAADAAPSAADAQAAQESSSSSKSSRDGATERDGRLHATTVRPETAEEQQRLQKHIMRSSELNYPAQFSLAGGRAKVASGSAAVMYAVDAARQSCLTAEEPSDLCCTVVTHSYAVELPARSQEQRGEPATADAAADESAASEGDPAAVAAGDSSPAAASSSASSSSSSSGTTTVMLPRFYITVQASAPDMKDVAAARKQQQRKQRYQARAADGRDSSRGPVLTRPGYVEVREEEWNQLKEQLQVVPHLTEQLQIMTRQHEQLLSLLAAQQSQQQGSD